jgi:hypothetical protein
MWAIIRSMTTPHHFWATPPERDGHNAAVISADVATGFAAGQGRGKLLIIILKKLIYLNCSNNMWTIFAIIRSMTTRPPLDHEAVRT